MAPGDAAVPDAIPSDDRSAPDSGDLATLLERARQGDDEALSALRALLDGTPGLWEQVGDLARLAEQSWIALIAGPDPLLREALERRVEALQVEIAGPDPSPLVRLLARRVVATWLQVQQADALSAQAVNLPIRQAAYLDRRQDAAHRRHLAALSALATVRRLLPAGGKSADPAEASRASSLSSGDENMLRAADPATTRLPVPKTHPPLTLFDATQEDTPPPTPARGVRKARRSTAS
jgi:hypothetical protein